MPSWIDGSCSCTVTSPKSGDVVVALIGEEATVKRFHPRGREVELRPANRTMEPIRVAAGDVLVQGVVVALQRTL